MTLCKGHRSGHELAEGRQVVEGGDECDQVLNRGRVVARAGRDATRLVRDCLGVGVGGVLRLLQRIDEARVAAPVCRVRARQVAFVLQGLGELDHRGVELRQMLDAPARNPVVHVAIDQERAEGSRDQGRDRDDGREPVADPPVGQRVAGLAGTRPPRAGRCRAGRGARSGRSARVGGQGDRSQGGAGLRGERGLGGGSLAGLVGAAACGGGRVLLGGVPSGPDGTVRVASGQKP